MPSATASHRPLVPVEQTIHVIAILEAIMKSSQANKEAGIPNLD